MNDSYYLQNRETILKMRNAIYQHRSYLKHRAERLEYCHQYYQDNCNEIKRRSRKYYRQHREYYREYQRQYRAKRREAMNLERARHSESDS